MTQNLIDKFLLLIILFFALLQNSAYATDRSNLGATQKINAQNLVNKPSLGCSSNNNVEMKELNSFYHKIYLADKFYKKDKIFLVSNYEISSVKSISFYRTESFSATHMDVDIKKFGIHVLRISAFAEEIDGDESFGYYFVVRGTPESISQQLISIGINVQHLMLEKTPAGNTRLKCILVG